ncbi:unnamed protein product [Eruca vesicaria subsp. sativa]|uniref:Uncharacterized protein n=1 Tax=Eruca vesicaria subsp. sativa TaxID=29727 RepID=A0ABC8JUZ6_ERUVS|nr:unnamed protein product [Eruca vesicaria subsp. sativa]
MDPIKSIDYDGFETFNTTHVDHGWKKVIYPKRNRKQKSSDQTAASNIKNVNVANGDNIFRSLEEQAEDRRKQILAAKMTAVDVEVEPNGLRSNGFEDSDEEIEVKKVEEVKKKKTKKEKKPKVLLPETAAKIADYFGRALSGVSLVQFPWVKMFKESPLSKLIDVSFVFFCEIVGSKFGEANVFGQHVPLAHIPEPVYKTSVDWISNLI